MRPHIGIKRISLTNGQTVIKNKFDATNYGRVMTYRRLQVTFHVIAQDREIIMRYSDTEDKCEACPSFSDRKCLVKEIVKLSEYKPGEKGTIFQVCGEPNFRLRMMELGFVKGTEIAVVKYAPLNDPMEFVIKGYHLTLRKDQAADILMGEPEKAA